MGFAHIEEHKAWLTLRRLRQMLLNPEQLRAQAPGVTCEVKVLKGLGQHSPGVAGGVEPIDRATADRAVALPAKTLNDVGAFEAEALLTVMAGMASEGHPKQLACLGVQPGLSTTLNPRRDPSRRQHGCHR